MIRRRPFLWLGVLLTLAAGAGLRAFQGQPPAPPQGTGLILGRVVDAASGKPVSGVLISLRDVAIERVAGRAVPPRLTLTDTQGRYVIRGLPAGSYQIAATVGGNGFSPSGFMVSGVGQPTGAYLNGGFGQRRAGGPLQTIELGDGQRIGDAVIRMWKGGAIDGVVVDEADEPLVGVSVAAARRSTDGRIGTGPSTKTDDRGRYHLGSLIPGEYFVVVPQTQILMPAETVDTVLAMPQPSSAISQFTSNGAPSPIATGVQIGASILSNPTGYVMNSLVPPQPQGGKSFVYQTTFFPAATSTGRATPIAVRSGDALTGMNVRLQPVSASEVSGTLVDEGGPVANFGVHLLPVETGDGASVLEVASAATNSRGMFTFPLVPSGQYRLLAIKPSAPLGPPQANAAVPVDARQTASLRAGSWAELSINVGADPLRALVMTMRAGAEVKGHVEFRGASPPPSVLQKNLAVFANAADQLFRSGASTPASAFVDGNGEFTIRGVAPGRTIIRPIDVAGAWSLQSVTANGVDVTDTAMVIAGESVVSNVTIVFTDQPAELAGTVREPGSGGEVTSTVFLFPADRKRWPDARVSIWSFRQARVPKSGAFRFVTLTPGDYLVVAVSDDTAADWPDQKFLTKIATQATPVRVNANQKATVSLTTAVIK